MIEYAVLNRSLDVDEALEGTIRSATGANRQVLDLLLRKKWIAREDVSAVRDASAPCRSRCSKSSSWQTRRQAERKSADDRQRFSSSRRAEHCGADCASWLFHAPPCKRW